MDNTVWLEYYRTGCGSGDQQQLWRQASRAWRRQRTGTSRTTNHASSKRLTALDRAAKPPRLMSRLPCMRQRHLSARVPGAETSGRAQRRTMPRAGRKALTLKVITRNRHGPRDRPRLGSGSTLALADYRAEALASAARDLRNEGHEAITREIDVSPFRRRGGWRRRGSPACWRTAPPGGPGRRCPECR